MRAIASARRAGSTGCTASLRDAMRPFSKVLLAAVALGLVGGAGFLACGRRKPAETGPMFLNQAPGVRYVGLESCRGCHAETASTFVHTGMGRSFYRMTSEGAIEDFARNNEVVSLRTGLGYRMLEREGKYYQRQFLLDSGGNETAVDEREMVYVLGSGNHSRSYVTVLAGKLFQMPVCWYPEKGIWDLCPGYEYKNDHFAREITETCVFCHNGRMELVAGTNNRFEEPFPLGIDCERCHGPGQLHVERWRDGKASPVGDLDPTIVNPRRLPVGARSEVCFQCHLGDSKATERVHRRERDPREYRPGQRLTEVFVPFWLREASQTEFGLSAQADRLMRSKCYQASGGKIECLTCHNPHVTVYRPDRPKGFFRERCLSCHELDDCTAPAQARQGTPSLPDDCVSCHMRRAQADDHPHARFIDHWIQRNPAEPEAYRSKALEFTPVFPEAYGSLPEADQAFYRGRAYLLRSLQFPGPLKPPMWKTAEDAFREAIGSGLDEAEAWFMLGKVLTFARRWEEASEAFREAVGRDPSHRDAALAMGTAMGQLGRVSDAAEVFRRILERNPNDVAALAELGRCQLAGGDAGDALALYERAIREEPWRASLHANRGFALYALKRDAEAVEACAEAVRLNPEDASLWKTYAEALEAAGRPSEAAAAGKRAQDLAAIRAQGPAPPQHQGPGM